MADVTASVVVDRPVRTVYNQWTQFEEFPRFMEGVEEVRQLDDARLAWKAKIGGVERSWEAHITEQRPDQVIAWNSTSGIRNNGRVAFEPLGEQSTKVELTIDVEPEGMVEKAGAGLGLIERRAEGDLERFREYIESKPAESGGWRGEIQGGRITDDE